MMLKFKQFLENTGKNMSFQELENRREELENRRKVEKWPLYILDIENPSEEVKRIAITSNPYIIGNIKNSSEDLKKLAILTNPFSILYLENPSLKLQKLAINLQPKVIGFIENPSIEIQQYALNKDRALIHDRNIRWHPEILKKYAGTISARDMGII